MGRDYKFSEDIRKDLLKGIEIVSNAVKVTLGPKGRNVLLGSVAGAPMVTKDGVSVAKEIELDCPFQNMGVQLLQEVASKTNDDTGDGTTTSTVLAYAIARDGMKEVEKGLNPIGIKKGIDLAVIKATNYIKDLAKSIDSKEEIKQVATISANNDSSIGELIADAMESVGKDGVITIENSNTAKTSIDVTEGMEIDKGYLSPYFAGDSTKVEMENSYILLCDQKITHMEELLPVLGQIAQEGKSVLIIAEDIEGEALATLVMNSLRGTINAVAIKAPSFGDYQAAILEDIAILTGAQVISERYGLKLKEANLDLLGKASKVKVEANSTTIVDGFNIPEVLATRIDSIKKEMGDCTSNHDTEQLQSRLAKLTGGIAVIKVGANTETELVEKKHRVEDALSATRAAIEEGIVSGGGLTLLRASANLDIDGELTSEEEAGFRIIKKALLEPMKQIASNAGRNGESIIATGLEEKNGIGYNALTGNWVDMIKAGIIDPAKVTRCALENAASIASLVLTTECAIAPPKLD